MTLARVMDGIAELRSTGWTAGADFEQTCAVCGTGLAEPDIGGYLSLNGYSFRLPECIDCAADAGANAVKDQLLLCYRLHHPETERLYWDGRRGERKEVREPDA